MKIGLYADGGYFCKCVTCSEIFHGDKRAVQCLRCAAKQLQTELGKAKKQILDYEQTEASVCPEDVGIKEYVPKLQAQLTTAKEGRRAAAGILDDLAKKLKEITGEQNVWEAVKQLAPANDENKRLRDAIQKMQNAKIANMKPGSVALYQMFIKETAEQALKGE